MPLSVVSGVTCSIPVVGEVAAVGPDLPTDFPSWSPEQLTSLQKEDPILRVIWERWCQNWKPGEVIPGEQNNSHELTPSLRRPYIHAIFFSTACRTACKHAFRFLRVLPEAVSTRHSLL